MLLGYPIDKPAGAKLPANMILTPSEELAHYKKAPGDPPLVARSAAAVRLAVRRRVRRRKLVRHLRDAETWRTPIVTRRNSRRARTGVRDGRSPEWKMIETKMTIDGQFEIIPKLP